MGVSINVITLALWVKTALCSKSATIVGVDLSIEVVSVKFHIGIKVAVMFASIIDVGKVNFCVNRGVFA